MYGNISCIALSLLFCIIYVPATMEQVLPPKAINLERIQLMENALSSMTFRKDGQLASNQDLHPFLETLKERYHTSKYYKTLLKAFQHGVLPKLTLTENDACDPAYTLQYQDPFNNSVTDASLKKFIFGSYDKRNEDSRQFCNYQKGLVCNTQTKRCECPQGSKMGPISEKGGAAERCLLEENEACSLIDLGHDPSSKYGALKKHLPLMILNLERPLSCKMGTQCRFKSSSKNIPQCYSINDGPRDKGKWNIDLGEDAAFFEVRKKVSDIHGREKREEKDYRKDLLEPVERDCDPNLGPPPGSEGAAPSTSNDVLEGGYCPPDRMCYEDYRDEIVMYDNSCNLNPYDKVYSTCQSLDDDRQFGRCEGKSLNRIIIEEKLELSKLTSYSRLGMGEACQYELEVQIRSWITKEEKDIMGNKYKVLIELDKLKNGRNSGLCDRTKLLQCSKEGTCVCLPNTQPRKAIMEQDDGESQTRYDSEYCYVASDNCNPRTLHYIFYATNQMEKDEINYHYNKKEEDEETDEYGEYSDSDVDNCRGSNWCVFTRDDSYLENEDPRFVCSTRNTGTTGYGPEEDVIVKPAPEPAEPSKPDIITTDKSNQVNCEEGEGEGCGFEEAGGTRKEISGILKIITIILVLNVIG